MGKGKNSADELKRLKEKEGYKLGMQGLAEKQTAWDENEGRKVSIRAFNISQGCENIDPVTNYKIAETELTTDNLRRLINKERK
uniref:Uncharacterized protein n=1 Tax=uncultured Microgenomates bacterium Rifle_16ft_4_minimus_5036 TaxID=1665119 RepID=A0A0H4T8Y7_9BACT|nr:hypothetical protein [uncultured Microgenomates bacterium Rifle_16ft_4_minimus_5036]